LSQHGSEERVDRRLWALGGFLAIALGGIIAAVLYAVTVDRPWAKPATNDAESPATRLLVPRISTREAGRAFREGAERPDYEAIEPFEDVFADIAAAIDEQDVELFLGRVNHEALIEQVNRQEPGRPLELVDAPRIAEGMVRHFVHNAEGAGGDNFEICRIRRSETDGVENATVYTRRRVFNLKATARQIWWLRRGDYDWEVYDLADVGTGLRVSTMAAECARDGIPAPTVEALMEYVPKMIGDDYGAAWEAIERLQSIPLPPSLAAYRAYLNVDVTQRLPYLFSTEETDAAYQKVEELAPRMPALIGRKAWRALMEERFEETLGHVDRFTRTLGIDPGILMVKGLALARLKRNDEAVAVHRQALALEPYAVDHIGQLAHLLPSDQSDEIVAEFRKIPEAHDWFANLGEELLQVEEYDDLDAVIGAMRELEPTNPTINYYKGQVLQHRHEFEAAAETYAASFKRVEEEQQLQFYAEGFITCMLADLRVEDAYGRAPLSRFAFDRIANQLLFPQSYAYHYPNDAPFSKIAGDEPEQRGKRHELYRAVASRHLPIEPDDPWLTYYDGQLCVKEERYNDAERIFASVAGKEMEEGPRDSLRLARLNALHLAGRDQFAYEHVPPADETFEQLAQNCEAESKWDALLSLVELRRQDAPTEPMLAYYEGRAASGQSRMDDAIGLLQVFIMTAEAPADVANGESSTARSLVFSARAELIRCLVKSQRWDEALAEVPRLEVKESVVIFGLLIQLARGDLAAAETSLQRLTEFKVELADIYEDHDIGPLLRSDACKALREKYPEPKPEPSAHD
jgi:tetratricopeptide (TPR) repeat protein